MEDTIVQRSVEMEDESNIGGPGKGKALAQLYRNVLERATDTTFMSELINQSAKFQRANAWRVAMSAHFTSMHFGDGTVPKPKLEDFPLPTITPRQVLEGVGFTEAEIQAYFARTKTTE